MDQPGEEPVWVRTLAEEVAPFVQTRAGGHECSRCGNRAAAGVLIPEHRADERAVRRRRAVCLECIADRWVAVRL